jgi:hypothetical protein
MTGTMKVIDSTGHTEIAWDTAKTVDVEKVREAFGSFQKPGFTAYGFKAAGQPGEVITEFDPTLKEIVIHGPMAGG